MKKLKGTNESNIRHFFSNVWKILYQHVINVKNHWGKKILCCLWNLWCIVQLKHTSIWIRYIYSSQNHHVNSATVFRNPGFIILIWIFMGQGSQCVFNNWEDVPHRFHCLGSPVADLEANIWVKLVYFRRDPRKTHVGSEVRQK